MPCCCGSDCDCVCSHCTCEATTDFHPIFVQFAPPIYATHDKYHDDECCHAHSDHVADEKAPQGRGLLTSKQEQELVQERKSWWSKLRSKV